MPPPEGDPMWGSGDGPPAADAELERLRRRVYAPGASATDRRRYAGAVAARQAVPKLQDRSPGDERLTAESAPGGQEPEWAATRPVRRRRLIRALVAGAAVLAVLSIVLAIRVVQAPEPMPSDSHSTLAPPILLRARTFADDPASALLLDRAFEEPGTAAALAAAGRLADAARSRVDPTWASRPVRLDGGGSSLNGVVPQAEGRAVTVRRGFRVTLSVLTAVPTSLEWRFRGYRAGEPHVPHDVLVVRTPPSTESRAALADVLLPADMTMTSFRLAVSPHTALAYDYLVQRPR